MNLDELAARLEVLDISGRDVQRIADDTVEIPVVLYSSLARFDSISDLLGPVGACIILYQTTSKTVGV